MRRTAAWPLFAIALAWCAGVGASMLWRHGLGSTVVPDAALGVGLAALLVLGPRAWPGLAIGAVCAALLQGLLSGSWRAPVLEGLLALLTALAAAQALRRSRAPRLASARELARFVAVCLVAALIRGVLGAVLSIHEPPAAAQALGALSGMLLLTPALLAWAGQPAGDWRPRRLPLGVVVPLLALVVSTWTARYAQYLDRDEEAGFVFQARTRASALSDRLQGALDALAAVDSILLVAPEVSQRDFERATQAWAGRHEVHAMGVLQRLQPDEHAAFEAALRAAGAPTPRLRSAIGDGGERPLAEGETVGAIRLIAPVERNAQVLGVNSNANPRIAPVIERALATKGASATLPFPLRLAGGVTAPGLVVYLPAAGNTARRIQLAFVTLRLDQVVPSEGRARVAQMACLSLPGATPPLVIARSHPEACDAGRGPQRLFGAEIAFADQRWRFEVREPAAARSGDALLVEGLAMVALSVVALLLLSTTGHARLHERVARRARAAQAAAEAAHRAKVDFLLRVRHELRAPLNALLGAIQVLRGPRRREGDEQKPWIDRIDHAGVHLGDMIEDLLDSSASTSGQLAVADVAVALAPLVATSADLAQQPGIASGVQWLVQPVPAEWRVQGDARRIRQVLVNLLTNAAKYNRRGGQVRVSASARPGRIVVTVQDDGIGMDWRQLEQLFQPFNRLGREGSGIEGMGIGLYLSRQLAERMGASLRVSSEPGRGTSFEFDLRRAPDGDAQPPSAVAGVRRLLAFEDDAIAIELLHAVAARRPDWQLATRDRLGEGLALVRTHGPDLILLDQCLPDGDGLALLAALRADPLLCTLPVVLISGDAFDTSPAADATIAKPWDLQALEQAIDTLLQRAPR